MRLNSSVFILPFVPAMLIPACGTTDTTNERIIVIYADAAFAGNDATSSPPLQDGATPQGDATSQADASVNGLDAQADGSQLSTLQLDAACDAALDPECPQAWSCNSSFSSGGPCSTVGKRCVFGCGPTATVLVCEVTDSGLLNTGAASWVCGG